MAYAILGNRRRRCETRECEERKKLKKDYVYECNFSSNIAIVIIPHVTIDKTKMYKSYRYNHKTAHKCNMKRNVLYSGVL